MGEAALPGLPEAGVFNDQLKLFDLQALFQSQVEIEAQFIRCKVIPPDHDLGPGSLPPIRVKLQAQLHPGRFRFLPSIPYPLPPIPYPLYLTSDEDVSNEHRARHDEVDVIPDAHCAQAGGKIPAETHLAFEGSDAVGESFEFRQQGAACPVPGSLPGSQLGPGQGGGAPDANGYNGLGEWTGQEMGDFIDLPREHALVATELYPVEVDGREVVNALKNEKSPFPLIQLEGEGFSVPPIPFVYPLAVLVVQTVEGIADAVQGQEVGAHVTRHRGRQPLSHLVAVISIFTVNRLLRDTAELPIRAIQIYSFSHTV